MTLRPLALLACSLAFVASPSQAQQEQFASAVRDLARRVTIGAEPAAPLGPLIDRMAEGLAGWDRAIGAFESRVAADLRGASDERAFQLHVELGLAYRQRGRLADALRQFDAAAALRRTASDVHVLRGLTFAAAGQSDDAARAVQAAWSLDRQNPVKAYYVLLFSAATDRQRARAALTAAYERSLTGVPAGRGAPFLMLDAIGDTRIGETRTGESERGETLPSAPIVADAATASAFALLAAGKYSEAVAALRLTQTDAERRPERASAESPLAHFMRARGDEAAGRIPEARRGYEAAVAGTLAGRGLLHVGIGRLAQVEGDVAGAIAAFGRAVRLNPNDAVAHRELGGAFAADDRTDDAFAELVAALLIDPADVSVLAAIGQLFLDSGRHADAVAPLRRTLQLAPGRFETHYALATALTHLGRTADAARELERFERGRQQMVEQRRRELDADVPGGGR